jgi:hypothetical protein
MVEMGKNKVEQAIGNSAILFRTKLGQAITIVPYAIIKHNETVGNMTENTTGPYLGCLY